jgi:signal peptidase II
VLAVVVLTRMALTTPPLDRFRLLAVGLVAGGAAGNLVDRIRSPQGVVDFFDLGFAAMRFPTFNIADIGVSTGAVLLAVSFWLADSRARAEA